MRHLDIMLPLIVFVAFPSRSPWLLYLLPLRFAQCLIPAEQLDIPLSDVNKHKKALKKVSMDFCNEQPEQVSNIFSEMK